MLNAFRANTSCKRFETAMPVYWASEIHSKDLLPEDIVMHAKLAVIRCSIFSNSYTHIKEQIRRICCRS